MLPEIWKNSISKLLPLICAAFPTGNPLNTFDPVLTSAEISHMFNITKPIAIFCEWDVLDTVNADAKIFTFGGATVVSELFKSTGCEEEFKFVCEKRNFVSSNWNDQLTITHDNGNRLGSNEIGDDFSV